MIPPLDVKITDSSNPILYLSSSMGSIYWDSLEISYCDSVESSSMKTSVLTSLDVTSTIHLFLSVDNANVNPVSHEDASHCSSSSCGLSSSQCPPIFHYDDNVMESMTTHDYPWDDMHHRAYFLPQ